MFIDTTSQAIEVPRLTPREVYALLQEDNYYILDVRPLDFERDASFIAGAHLCPLVYLESRYSELPHDRPIIITDWAMRQSLSAAKFLISKGFTVRGVLRGGMERWRQEALPYEDWEADGRIRLSGDTSSTVEESRP